MAIAWSNWDYSGNNGMRIGIDGSAESVSHGESVCTITWRVFTENRYQYADNNQEINYSGSRSGQKVYNNTQGGQIVLRDTFTTTHNYSASSYGSSPGKHTVTATIGYTYNGSHPSKTVSVTIPARPYAKPGNPSNMKAVRTGSGNDMSVSWDRPGSAGSPVTYQSVQRRYVDGTGDPNWLGIFNWGTDYFSNGTSSFVYGGAFSNSAIQFRVQLYNSAGESAWVESNVQYTIPDAPADVKAARLANGQVRVTWRDRRAYGNGTLQVERSENGGAWSQVAQGIQEGVESWTDTAPVGGDNRYRVRDWVLLNTPSSPDTYIWSAWSLSNTVSTEVPPLAPTQLVPNGTWFDASSPTIPLSWQHNAGSDGADQSVYQVRWSSDGGSSWTELAEVASSVQSASLEGLTNGLTYQWQVRTKGVHASFGPWSASATIRTATPPVVSVTEPVDPVTALPVITRWDYAQAEGQEQSEFDARVYAGTDSSGAELRRWVTSSTLARSRLLNFPFVDGETYTVGVRSRAVGDIWSAWDYQTFTMDLLPPAQVDLSGSFDGGSGVVQLSLHAHDPVTGVTAAVDHVDIQRRIDGSPWVTIHAGLEIGTDTIVLDTAPTLKGSNEYRLIVTSVTPSTAVTIPVEVVTLGFESTHWAFLSYGDGFTQVLRGQGNPALSEQTGRARASVPVLGRANPLLLVGGQKSRERSISLRLLSDTLAGTDGPSSTGAEFEQAGREAGIVLWRDWTGARIFGRLSGVQVTHNRDHDDSVSFSVTQTDYDENVT